MNVLPTSKCVITLPKLSTHEHLGSPRVRISPEPYYCIYIELHFLTYKTKTESCIKVGSNKCTND